MEIFKTRVSAETEKRVNSKYNPGDMVVKVKNGFAIMSAKEYINWLVKQ
jgi:hypothetical protein